MAAAFSSSLTSLFKQITLKVHAFTVINIQDTQQSRCDATGSDILQLTNHAFIDLHEAYCICRIKGARMPRVLRWVSRKIKISYAILQSNLDSSEQCAFFSSRDKEHTIASTQTHKITNTGTRTHTYTQLHAPLNTLPSHFFNYQAGENSGEGLSVWSSVSISSVNNTSLGQS